MKICTTCGTQLDDSVMLCPRCGQMMTGSAWENPAGNDSGAEPATQQYAGTGNQMQQPYAPAGGTASGAPQGVPSMQYTGNDAAPARSWQQTAAQYPGQQMTAPQPHPVRNKKKMTVGVVAFIVFLVIGMIFIVSQLLGQLLWIL